MPPMKHTKINDDYLPPSEEQWRRLSPWSRWYMFHLALWECWLPKVPWHVHVLITTALCSIVLMTVVPLRPMSIPVVIGGGVAGGLLISGGKYGITS
jgi:hypothetical protein